MTLAVGSWGMCKTQKELLHKANRAGKSHLPMNSPGVGSCHRDDPTPACGLFVTMPGIQTVRQTFSFPTVLSGNANISVRISILEGKGRKRRWDQVGPQPAAQCRGLRGHGDLWVE